MANKIRRVDYFYATVEDESGEGYELLTRLAELRINLLAFTAIPVGPTRTQFAIFPEDTAALRAAASRAGLLVDGPHPALLVQGDDELGALARVHRQLAAAGVSVYASSAVTDGKGSYGYVVYVRPTELERATKALGI